MKKDSNAYLGLAFLTGLNLFNYLDRYVLAAVLAPLQAELHLNDTAGGALGSAFMIGYFCTSPIFGYLGDRYQRKWLIALGVFIWSVGTILTAYMHTYWTLIACRLLIGFGEASYATLAPAWLSDLFPAERRNNALTIFYVAIPVGSALGYGVGAFALGHGSWRDGFFWAGIPGLALALLLLLLREPRRGAADPEAARSDADAPPSWRDVFRLFRIRDFTLVLVGYTAYTFTLGAFAYWGPKFLSLSHDLSQANASWFFSLVLAATGLVGTMVGGFAATAWQRRNRAGYALLLTGSMVAAVPVAALAFLTGSVFVSQVCLATAMFLLFLPTGPVNTIIVESVPVALRASAMAASIFVIHLFGDLWSPLAVGALADWWSQEGHPAAGLQRAVLVLPVMLAVGAVFWGLLCRRKAHETPGAPVELPA